MEWYAGASLKTHWVKPILSTSLVHRPREELILTVLDQLPYYISLKLGAGNMLRL